MSEREREREREREGAREGEREEEKTRHREKGNQGNVAVLEAYSHRGSTSGRPLP